MAPNHRTGRDQIHRIQSPINITDFTSLADHQSQTPWSFYSGPPILHHICRNACLRLPTRDISEIPYFADYVQQPIPQTVHGEGTSTVETQVEVRGIDVWITSENLRLAFPERNGTEPSYVAIPYPLIVLHANQPASTTNPGCLYLQIRTAGSGPSADDEDDNDDDTYNTITLSIVPPTIPAIPSPTVAPPSPPMDPVMSVGEVQKMYDAVTNCSNLHPEPGDDDDNEPMEMDGAGPAWVLGNGTTGHHEPSNLPPPMPGSGGWITAENAAEFFDSDGNLRLDRGETNGDVSYQSDLPPPMPGSGGWITSENVDEFFDEEGALRQAGRLGNGAGRIRGRESVEGGVDGDDETKWRRTA